MKPIKSDFGNLAGEKVDLYTLKNANGMVVKITNYGATITSIQIPDVNGKLKEIACGFDTIEGYFSEDYKANSPYFGSTVGRYCSQIKDAKFSLNGKTYDLSGNCGTNNLHGGVVGFDKRIWDSTFENNDQSTIKMSLLSKDMEEGFPGNVQVDVSFTLTDDNELKIDYNATTDADTPLSITNHTYFNLEGFSETIENHNAQVHTNKRLELDDTGAATGKIVNVENQADDLRVSKRIGDVHEAINDGFEHFYVFDNEKADLNQVASISSEKEQIRLDVFSTEPCMLLYTGKYTSDDLKRENGIQYGKYKGFCCETHRYPNGPNIEGSPKSITKAGENFKSTTVFKFSF
ncbi:aldose epimerase family protein [Maribacter sp. 1_MG-2023]|uniref:aldose epimerase family protein n=1 Tax=Maribacter sp. 1_MG-2023 TaxID=3062677 RepID=UPI0026E32A8C|nr:aldose epimerase family protein [Maribacter sp. 1_MG-2023]MDO6470433.1 aldose epimerase family protein [Maribacter sp. 1_MG-2023]